MTAGGDGTDTSTEEHGLTEEDREQIEAFLAKPRYERTVDDLRRSSKQ